jgi:parallel beta-helix repeat protein
MDKKYGILIVSVTILVLCLVGTASATNWSVDGSGGEDFTGIQDAINNASDGDTIFVHSGVYYENVVVDKSVTLKGIDQPVVDANSSGRAITLTEDRITLVGFNATNSGSSGSDVGIKVTSNNNTITGNNVSNNGVGIGLYYSSNNNTITGNNVSNNGVGICISSSSNNNTITGNNIRNNNWSGISLDYASNNNTVTGNVFVNDGLFVYFSYQNTVEENTVNGKPLVYLEDVSDYKVEDAGQVIIVNCNNITIETLDLSNTSRGIALLKTENSKISNNTVCNNKEGISLYDSSNNSITGNNVSNNGGGIGLYYSSNNKIYFNNFRNNVVIVYSIYDSTNIWNSPSEMTYTYDGTIYESYLGNYWEDYEGTDAEGDGIGDTHYSIDSEKDESDNYPLMKPFENYYITTSACT